MKVYIETDRLLLRDIEESDAAGIFALDSDPEVHQYLGNHPITSMQQAEEMICLIRQQYVDKGVGRWAVIDKASNEFVGWSGLKYELNLRKEFSYFDLGFRLRPKYWGQGIATESARESLKFGFTKMNLTQICAAADIANFASNAVLKKVGLQFKEVFQYEEIPVNWYVLNREDWLKHVSRTP